MTLATPISTPALLGGKALAAAIPGVLTAWASYVLFLIGARVFSVSDRVFSIFVDPMWLVALLLLAPLLTVMAVGVGIIVSSRTTDPRAAEQLGSFVVLPLILLVIGVMTGFLQLSAGLCARRRPHRRGARPVGCAALPPREHSHPLEVTVAACREPLRG